MKDTPFGVGDRSAAGSTLAAVEPVTTLPERILLMKDLTWLLGLLASLISIGAGLYLLTSSSASADTTVFDILMHGIGAYCVARGVWMLHEMGMGAGNTKIMKRLIG